MLKHTLRNMKVVELLERRRQNWQELERACDQLQGSSKAPKLPPPSMSRFAALYRAACADLAKPGGTLYFSTINRNPKSFTFAIVGAEHILQLLPAGTHEYAKFIKPSELAGWLREAGLVLEGMTGLTYNPLTKRYRLDEADVSVNYMVRAAKPA